MEINNQQQAKIDEIMDEFNFNKVHLVMEHLEWKWFTTADGGVPSVGDIRREARRLLSSLALQPAKSGPWRHSTATGGLSATRWGDTDEYGPWENFSLEFVLEDWRTEEPEEKSKNFYKLY
jgi:hypothetical protein